MVCVTSAVHVVGDPTGTGRGEQERPRSNARPGVTRTMVLEVLPSNSAQTPALHGRYGVHEIEHAASPGAPAETSVHVDALSGPVPFVLKPTSPVGVAPDGAAVTRTVHTVDTRVRTGLGEHATSGGLGACAAAGVTDTVKAKTINEAQRRALRTRERLWDALITGRSCLRTPHPRVTLVRQHYIVHRPRRRGACVVSLAGDRTGISRRCKRVPRSCEPRRSWDMGQPIRPLACPSEGASSPRGR